MSEIKKHREAILNCEYFQSSYIKEKKEHPFRGNACQKMIDIYQERIAEHQEKSYKILNSMNKLFKSMLQKMRDLSEVKEFQEIINSVRKNTAQSGLMIILTQL